MFFNQNLKINAAARSVLIYLSEGTYIDFYSLERNTGILHIDTFAFYNGRERGIGLEIVKTREEIKTLYIVFAEHKRSDEIFVEKWEQGGYADMNPPAWDAVGRTDKVYEERKCFSPDQVHEVCNYIKTLVHEFAGLKEE